MQHQQCNIRLQFIRCSCHRLRIVSRLQTMRTEVSWLIMKMKMVLTESCDHIILSHLLILKTRKYLLQVQVNNQHLNPFPLPSAQRAGEGVASCYWQVSKPPSACHLNSPIVSLHPPACLRHLKLFSAFSIVLLSYMNDNDTMYWKCQRPEPKFIWYFQRAMNWERKLEVAGVKCWGRDARTRSCCWRQSSLIVILPWWVLDFG